MFPHSLGVALLDVAELGEVKDQLDVCNLACLRKAIHAAPNLNDHVPVSLFLAEIVL